MNQPPEFYLVRHGQDEDNANGILNGHRDMPLTQIGINQAQQLSQKIKATCVKFDFILTSPLQRTTQTATIISQSLELADPIPEPLLIERDFGIMTGKTHSDIIPLCSPDILKTATITYFLSSPHAETFPDLIVRANNLIAKLNTTYPNQTLLLVSHGDFGKMLFAAYYKLDWPDVLSQFHFGNSEMLKLSPHTNPDNAKIISITQHNL